MAPPASEAVAFRMMTVFHMLMPNHFVRHPRQPMALAFGVLEADLGPAVAGSIMGFARRPNGAGRYARRSTQRDEEHGPFFAIALTASERRFGAGELHLAIANVSACPVEKSAGALPVVILSVRERLGLLFIAESFDSMPGLG